MSSPVGYPQRNAYPMFSSTSRGDVPVGKDGANLVPVMANVTSSAQVVGGFQAGATQLSIPWICTFPDFSPSILASFVAGTTAAQSGNTVTVTATAHGIVGSTAKNGYRIYYPGSPNIPAGFYGGFAWVSDNTITFQSSSSVSVSAESVNAGAAFTSAVDVAQINLPANTLRAGSRATAIVTRQSESGGATKTVGISYGGSMVSFSALVSGANVLSQRIGFVVPAASKQIGMGVHESFPSTSGQILTGVNTEVNNQLTVFARTSAAGSYIVIDAVSVEVIVL